MAISLLEYLGDKATEGSMQFSGTGVSKAGMTKARAGFYPENIQAEVSPEQLGRDFTKAKADILLEPRTGWGPLRADFGDSNPSPHRPQSSYVPRQLRFFIDALGRVSARCYSRRMPKKSAGLLRFRIRAGKLEVLLVHLGGPFWSKKDAGAWFVPKGEIQPGEDELAAAQREFREETGFDPMGPYIPIGEVKQKSGKTVVAWAFESDCDPSKLKSNTFQMEWPPRSGKQREFPEVDRAAFFPLDQAHEKIHPSVAAFLSRLASLKL